MTRRAFLLAGASGLGTTAALGWALFRPGPSGAAQAFQVVRSDAEWRALLTPQQYAVLRKHGTEWAFTSPLNGEKRKGTFHCAACDNALYASETKFDSGTGWPSFTAALPDAVGTSVDTKLFMLRTEVHCARCGGHLGHVFDDGPPPTGMRHCINGVALVFKPVVA
jgi:peptide-methionine (R)-S-oxide reductase